MRYLRYLRRLLFSLAIILSLGVTSFNLVAAKSAPNLLFFINSIDASAFPDISLKVRAVDPNSNSLGNLSVSQLHIFEDKSEVSPESINILSAEKGPAAVIFLVDMGRYSRDALSTTRLKVLLTYFMTDYFRDGIDSVAIYARNDGGEKIDKNVTILRPTHSQAELKNAIDHLQMVRSTVSSSVLNGVLSAADDMTVFLDGQAGRASTALVVISPYNETNLPDVAVLGNDLRAKNVMGYAIYTYENVTRLDPFKQFTELTGGQVVRVPSSGDTTAANTTKMYDEIYSRDQLINLKYRSSYGQSGNRKVSIVNANETLERAADSNTYMVNLNDPRITLKSAPVESIKPGDKVNLTVELSPWGDSIERQLVKAELFIDSNLEVTLPAADNPTVLTSPITFKVPTDKLEAGVHTIDITVTDELGLKGSISPVTLTVGKARIEPTQVVPTATPKVNCRTKPFASECIGVGVYVVIGVIFIAIIGLLVYLLVYLLMRTNKRISQVMQKPGSMDGGGFEEAKTAIYGRPSAGGVNDQPLARMHILVAGKGLENEAINIYSRTTSFGRNPQKCDHQLYGMTDQSSVSGLHCTLSYDYGRFMLTDDNSANGTYVGGKAITPNEPYELNDGDEIILGDLSLKGAKMRFEVVDTSKVLSKGGNAEEVDPDHTEIGRHFPVKPNPGTEPDRTEKAQKGDYPPGVTPSNSPKKKSKSDDDWMNELQ